MNGSWILTKLRLGFQLLPASKRSGEFFYAKAGGHLPAVRV